jgi:DNA-binding GntR family transcriptional regulator
MVPDVNESSSFSTPSTLVEEVVRVLTLRIIRGELPPNARLIEEDLARQFGISRPPIRESFRTLEREGLVTITPRRGVRVKGVEPKEVEEIYACRIALASLAVRLAVRELQPDDAEKLRQLAGEMEDASRNGDLDRYLALNIAFHDFVSDVGGNGTLRDLIRSLGTRVWRFRYLSLAPPDRMKRSAALHRILVRALVSGDADGADLAVRRIIEEAHAALEQILIGDGMDAKVTAHHRDRQSTDTAAG